MPVTITKEVHVELASASPDVVREFNALVKAENVWETAVPERIGSRLWSGMDLLPGPTPVASAEQLLKQASKRIADREAWRASPDGQFFSAMLDVENAFRAGETNLEYIRSARSRGFGRSVERDVASRNIDELRALARRINAALNGADTHLAAIAAAEPRALGAAK